MGAAPDRAEPHRQPPVTQPKQGRPAEQTHTEHRHHQLGQRVPHPDRDGQRDRLNEHALADPDGVRREKLLAAHQRAREHARRQQQRERRRHPRQGRLHLVRQQTRHVQKAPKQDGPDGPEHRAARETHGEVE